MFNWGDDVVPAPPPLNCFVRVVPLLQDGGCDEDAGAAKDELDDVAVLSPSLVYFVP